MLLNIVLVGAGEVGFNLSKFLSKENYNLTVIDINESKCNRVKNSIDARVIEGDGCSQKTLQNIDMSEVDYLIALTKIDEVNLVASKLAKEGGAKKVISRLRNIINLSNFSLQTLYSVSRLAYLIDKYLENWNILWFRRYH